MKEKTLLIRLFHSQRRNDESDKAKKISASPSQLRWRHCEAAITQPSGKKEAKSTISIGGNAICASKHLCYKSRHFALEESCCTVLNLGCHVRPLWAHKN